MANGSQNMTEAFSSAPDSSLSLSVSRISLVLMFRAGMVLVQFGSVPTECFYDSLLQNVVEFSVATTSYGLLGALLSFGKESLAGIVGYGRSGHTDDVISGFCAVVMGSAVITTFLSSRLHFLGCSIIAFAYAGLLQPILMHWIWHEDGWMNNARFIINESVSLRDHGGSLVVHVSSGCVGLVAIAFLGRRLLRLNFLDDSSLGAESPATTITGYFLVLLGLIGFSLPPKASHSVGVVLINDFLALAGGSLAAIASEFAFCPVALNYWMILRCMQGCVSGLVVISSSVRACDPPWSFAVAFVAGVCVDLSSKIIHKSSVEDYANVTTVHVLSGMLSCLLQPVVAEFNGPDRIGLRRTAVGVLWHVVCLMAVVSASTILFVPVLALLRCSGFLRNRVEENCHRRSKILSRKYDECPVRRLFVVTKSEELLEPGGSGKMADVEVGSECGGAGERPQMVIGEGHTDRKAKQIYTIRNPTETPSRDDGGFCFGDAGATAYKATESRVIARKIATRKKMVTRKKSLHLLRKSRRFVDLSRNKPLEKSWTKKVGGYRGFDDGITVIKMPSSTYALNVSD